MAGAAGEGEGGGTVGEIYGGEEEEELGRDLVEVSEPGVEEEHGETGREAA